MRSAVAWICPAYADPPVSETIASIVYGSPDGAAAVNASIAASAAAHLMAHSPSSLP
jgi:hypothetical protein